MSYVIKYNDKSYLSVIDESEGIGAAVQAVVGDIMEAEKLTDMKDFPITVEVYKELNSEPTNFEGFVGVELFANVWIETGAEHGYYSWSKGTDRVNYQGIVIPPSMYFDYELLEVPWGDADPDHLHCPDEHKGPDLNQDLTRFWAWMDGGDYVNWQGKTLHENTEYLYKAVGTWDEREGTEFWPCPDDKKGITIPDIIEEIVISRDDAASLWALNNATASTLKDKLGTWPLDGGNLGGIDLITRKREVIQRTNHAGIIDLKLTEAKLISRIIEVRTSVGPFEYVK